jgi:hypothetical protein
MIRLALDPGQGTQSAWPIALRDGPPRWDEALLVVILNQWPDAQTLDRLTTFARAGGSVVLFVQPGLEESWSGLDGARRMALEELLPSAPLPPLPSQQTEVSYHASIVRPDDPVLADIGDPRQAEGRLVVTRLLRFEPGGSRVTAIINAAPNDADSGAKPQGLLYRRTVGGGQVYTWATLPDRTCGNLRVWELFPPALVNSADEAAQQEVTLNAELGEPLVLAAQNAPAGAEVDLTPPGQEAVKVAREADQYVYSDTAVPGLYVWRWHSGGQSGSLGWSNVMPAAREARLVYRRLEEVAGNDPTVIAGRSLQEVRRDLADGQEARPAWTAPIAVVLLLLCLESLLGALPKGRKAAANPQPGNSSAVYFTPADSR